MPSLLVILIILLHCAGDSNDRVDFVVVALQNISTYQPSEAGQVEYQVNGTHDRPRDEPVAK
jgi:hypothetical protein